MKTRSAVTKLNSIGEAGPPVNQRLEGQFLASGTRPAKGLLAASTALAILLNLGIFS
jgi:hypothetical protein